MIKINLKDCTDFELQEIIFAAQTERQDRFNAQIERFAGKVKEMCKKYDVQVVVRAIYNLYQVGAIDEQAEKYLTNMVDPYDEFDNLDDDLTGHNPLLR